MIQTIEELREKLPLEVIITLDLIEDSNVKDSSKCIGSNTIRKAFEIDENALEIVWISEIGWVSDVTNDSNFIRLTTLQREKLAQLKKEITVTIIEDK